MWFLRESVDTTKPIVETGQQSQTWLSSLCMFAVIFTLMELASGLLKYGPQIGFKVKTPDEIVVGNWRDEKFLEGRV
ncbi:unnamed protein product, partial [Ectocarpus sp. 12 AP-2014]